MRFKTLSCALALMLGGFSAAANADGLSDLKAALHRLSGQQVLRATLSVKTEHRQGEGREASTELGAATLSVEDDAQGLRLAYAADALAQVQGEDLARENDAQAKTPAGRGLNALDFRAIRAMTQPGDSLQRLLARATFKSESADNWNGHPARVLNFDLGPGKLNAQGQKYVKKTEGSLQIWIAADGTPLESRATNKLSGRFALVVSFDASDSTQTVYERVGDRLIASRKSMQQSGSGAGEKGEDKSEFTLQLKP